MESGRGEIAIDRGANDETVKAAALALDGVERALAGKSPRRINPCARAHREHRHMSGRVLRDFVRRGAGVLHGGMRLSSLYGRTGSSAGGQQVFQFDLCRADRWGTRRIRTQKLR